MRAFVRLIDAVSEAAGKLAAWTFFAVGLFVSYEVLMRYAFVSPTIWVDEVSRICQVWAAYGAAAYTLKHREMIVIDVAFKDPQTLARRLADSFALLVIVIFAAVTVWFGFELWLKATLRGHTTDSFLAPPKWLTHASVWVGFTLLLCQALAETVKIWRPGADAAPAPGAAP